jgi:hypothetical protein
VYKEGCRARRRARPARKAHEGLLVARNCAAIVLETDARIPARVPTSAPAAAFHKTEPMIKGFKR